MGLPTTKVYAHGTNSKAEAYTAVVDDDNTNLSPGQKELLRWHYKVGHFNFGWIQNLFHQREGDQEPALMAKNHKACSCPHPKCASCLYGKQHHHSSGAQRHVDNKDRVGVLIDGNLTPGQVVSVDQFESRV